MSALDYVQVLMDKELRKPDESVYAIDRNIGFQSHLQWSQMGDL